ncbi:MAG: hypothetical protein GXY74_01220 [Phycisphaerae bacterium]|nr:hypothetical protein [Phycisphaerae bacterium]
MKTFTDNTGRTWSVTVNVDAVKRVKGLLGVNLLEVVDGKLLEQLVSDPVLLCDLVYSLCKPEADARQVSDEEFGRAMAGDTIDGATTALLEELVGFFPRERRRLLAKALGKLRTLEAMALKAAEDRLDSPALEKEMAAALARLGDSSGSLPESSVSTPDR